MPSYTVRRAANSDLDGILSLYTHLHDSDDPRPERDRLQQVWTSIIEGQGLHYIVAEDDGQLVGTCALAIIPNLTRGARPYGLIENVVTRTDHRRRGIGTALLERALAIAWSADAYKVMLLTGRGAEEIFRFYESAGFARGHKTGFIAYPPG